MALLFLDSFDHYTNAADKYLAGGSHIVAGRHGNGHENGELRLALTPGSSQVVVGAAFKLGTTFNVLYEFYDRSNQICSVSSMNDGSLQVMMFGGPAARSPSDGVRLNQWHYIELDLTIASAPSGPFTVYSLPACTVYLDGAQVLTTTLGSTSIFTPGPSAYNWTHIDILAAALATIDDLYVLDGSGPAPHNAPLGDVQIDVIRPNGAGATTEWSPVGSAATWSAVDDLTPDDDSTYVRAGSSPLSDLYTMEDVHTSNGIIGAQILVCARRSEEGFASVTPLLRHAGVTTELVTRAVSASYFYRNRDVFVEMPNGDPLTDANVNALQAGVKRTS